MLNNVSIVNGRLLATSPYANCESEIVSQNAGDTDFESIRNTRVHWYLNNISSEQSIANQLVTNTPINTGDKLFIRKNDGTIIETLATGVVQNTAPIHPVMTSNTLPSGIVTASDGSESAWVAFNGNDSDNIILPTGGWVQYQFANNEPKIIYNYYLKTKKYGIFTGIEIQGSLDGINWSTISTEPYANIPNETGAIFKIKSPGSYSYYRLQYIQGNDIYRLYTFSLLSEEGTKVDTSVITAGEIPSKVFLFKDKIKFNGLEATLKDKYYEYGTTGDKLYLIAQYNDVLLSGRQLVTRIEFSTPGNEVKEITGQIFKEV